MPLDGFKSRAFSRRSALKAGFGIALASQLALVEELATTPQRAEAASSSGFPAIQFDIGNFIAPPVTLNDGAGNVQASFATVFTYLVPARLLRTPGPNEWQTLEAALQDVESVFPFSPSGIFVFVSYGVPYFNRLPGGINGSLSQAAMPQLLSGTNPDGTRNALAEAVPSPTDVSGSNPGITKDRFNVPVVIEKNDMLFTMRSDSVDNLNNVLAWFKGSNNLGGFAVQSPPFGNLISFGTTRVQFVQRGLPRKLANQNGFEYAPRINPDSPMWMGFLDQQVNASGPAAICTFAGNSSARFTDASPSDYLGLGGIQHLSHDIEDLFQFYATPNQDSRHPDGEDATERLMYMFRANQVGTSNGLPAPFNASDPFTNGGCPAFVNNTFQGTNDAFLDAQDAGGKFNPNDPASKQQTETFTGLPRIGHNQGLQRSSRANDANHTPIHIRMDGPGLSSMDVPAFQTFPGGTNVPAGSTQPKLQFTIFVPTSEFFRVMRQNVAAQDLQAQFHVDPDDNGLERFITSTRRQNFLCPPRNVRAFPLIEFTGAAAASTTNRPTASLRMSAAKNAARQNAKF